MINLLALDSLKPLATVSGILSQNFIRFFIRNIPDFKNQKGRNYKTIIKRIVPILPYNN